MRMPNRHNEKGIALILSILALLLLSAAVERDRGGDDVHVHHRGLYQREL